MMKNTIKILMSSALFFGLGSSPVLNAALNCDVSNQQSLDWDDAGRDWPDPTGANPNYNPTLAHTETVGGIDFDFVFSSDQPNADFLFSLGAIAGQLGTPNDQAGIVGPGDLDGDGAIDQGLSVAVSSQDTTGAPIDIDVILTATLSEPVSGFEFTVSDVDHSEAAQVRQDQVTVVGSYLGNPVIPVLSATSATPTFTIAGNTATAIVQANADANAGFPGAGDLPAIDGLLTATFDQLIDSFTVIYADADETTADGDLGGTRGISMMNDFAFCPAPDLSITKTDGVGNYTPGTPFSYDIVVTNNGSGSANGSTFNDALPTWATGVAFSCAAAGGAACPAGTITGAGDVIPTLPEGGSLTFTVTGTYSPDMADYP